MFVSLLHVTVTMLLNHTSAAAAAASGWPVGRSHTSPQTQTASDHQGWILTGFEANLQFQNMSRRRKVPVVSGGGWSWGWSSAWVELSVALYVSPSLLLLMNNKVKEHLGQRSDAEGGR